MKCLNCGAGRREGAKFCKSCGNKMNLACPQCANACPSDSVFCDQCGCDLHKAGPAKLPDCNRPRSYTPKHLADKILATRGSMEGERKIVTVMFADVANSTSMFEKLDPEDVHAIMDCCLRLVLDEVHKYEGTVNQFLGDGVMAIFGAPISHEDHAQRACHAALAVQQALAPYGESLKKLYGIDFKMRIGLNCGPVVVGAVGDDLRMDYTAKGDIVNLASRMETSAEPGEILVPKNLYKQVKEFFEFEFNREVRVKGKEEPIEAYRLIKSTEVETRIAASAAKGLTKFVGRTRELESLREALERLNSGEGQVVGIVGEAGLGKSRLLLEFRNSLPQDEYGYFEGRCLHYGGSMPYLPVLGIVRSFIGVKEGEQEHIVRHKLEERILGLDKNLRHTIAPLQELLSMKVEDEAYAKLDPNRKREMRFEAFRDLLIRGSEHRPLVLAIEDLQWIDKTTEEFLDFLIGWLPRTGILLLLLYRSEYVHRWGGKSHYSKIAVGELSTNRSAELLAAILEGGDAGPELKELILGRAGGNPFFIEELTHSLLENGSIQEKGGRFVLAMEATGVQVPDTVQGIIAARMDRLEENLKKIMQMAAVIGREFAFRILEAIAEVKGDVKLGVLNLQGLEFIYEKSHSPELEYVFKHALTQEVAYNSLLVQRRKESHERTGKAIEEIYAHRLEEFYEMLAWHYSHSNNRDKAWQYLRLSGQKALLSNSHREALRLFKQALELLGHSPQTAEIKRDRVDIILMMAGSMRPLGYPEGSIDLLLEGESLAKEVGDEKALTNFFGYLGNYYNAAGTNPVLAKTYTEKALSTSELTGAVDTIAPAVYDLAIRCTAKSDCLRICEVVPKCLELIEKTRTQSETFGRPYNIYPVLKAAYGWAKGAMGSFDAGERVLEDCRKDTRHLSNPYTLAHLGIANGYFYLLRGDGNRVVEHFGVAAEQCGKSQYKILHGLALAWKGYGLLLLEQPDNALKSIEKGLEIHQAVGVPLWLGAIHAYLALAHLQLGNPETAIIHAGKGIELSRANSEGMFEASAEMYLGCAMGAGSAARFKGAKEHTLRGIAIADGLKLKPVAAVGRFYLGELSASCGQSEEAMEHLRRAETMFREMGMDYWLGKAQQVLAKL